jgi:hypothetical protein
MEKWYAKVGGTFTTMEEVEMAGNSVTALLRGSRRQMAFVVL